MFIAARFSGSWCKAILKLSTDYKNNKNIDQTISSAAPPIFWKDKKIVEDQINNWSPEKIKELIYKINNLELIIKKNVINPVKATTNFILNQCS